MASDNDTYVREAEGSQDFSHGNFTTFVFLNASVHLYVVVERYCKNANFGCHSKKRPKSSFRLPKRTSVCRQQFVCLIRWKYSLPLRVISQQKIIQAE
jgi:hypothetical protein